ncbi:MAG: NAD-dependent epimerase/dehydratase [Firmicutes bacterium]|nr:NAD-dependent epimerase/dehydratase [Bacillota bacterium]
MRVLVTGAGGFVGGYLVSALADRGHHIVAGGIQDSNCKLAREIETLNFDITDYQRLTKIIGKIKPDAIIHLAAQSMVQRAWEEPGSTIAVNTIGTINLIKAVTEHVPGAKIINIGTSEEYGLTGGNSEPLEEHYDCLPQNPYAVSKLAAGQIALQLAKKDHLNIVHVRPFNHFGPGQRRGYAVSDFAAQVAQIEKRLCPPVINVGDLSAQRDFTDVRDVIEAYITLLEKNVETGIYNVCSGQPRSINGILNFLIEQSRVPITIQIDREKLRPSDVPLFVGSASKIKKAVGWEPRRVFEDSLLETLEWWRKQDMLAAATLRR